MTKAKRKRAREEPSVIDARSFVFAWQRSENVDEFCEMTGMRPASACVRASRLRKRGVPLKLMYAGGRPSRLDIEELAAIAARLTK